MDPLQKQRPNLEGKSYQPQPSADNLFLDYFVYHKTLYLLVLTT